MAIAVVIPGQFGSAQTLADTYARRRRAVLVVLASIALVLFLGAGHVVANRGGAPASASAIRPAASPAAPGTAGAAHLYIVQPGDTLWSIGERFHGSTPLVDYVDGLVEANGGTALQIAQPLALP
jgi:hypothetical protein